MTTTAIILDGNMPVIMQILQRKKDLEARLTDVDDLEKENFFSGMESANRESAYVIRDYFIQVELERIMSGYDGSTDWSVDIRVGGLVHRRPSLVISNAARDVGQTCEEIRGCQKIGGGYSKEKFNPIYTYGLLSQRLDPGHRVQLTFKGIHNPDAFKPAARQLLYAFMQQEAYQHNFGRLDLLDSSYIQTIAGGN